MHTIRPLYAWEIREAQRVFAERLNYDSVRVHENANWPDTVHKIGLWLKRTPCDDVPNAITLGNHCYFPVKLLESPVSPDHPEHYKICWLMHELTHAWQYQHLGWRYLPMTLDTQLRKGTEAYNFGGEAGLVESHNKGKRLADFNLEQQGDIARTYYDVLARRGNGGAWLPFIQEFQGKESV
jgi:hypothetical protein